MLKKQNVSVDLRIVCAVLLLALIGSVVLWKPWQSTSTRTISVSGEASTKAEPDEYQFSPTYQNKGTDRAAIQTELNTKINEIVAKLKELGVSESDITLASSTYDNYWNDGTNEVTSNTVTVVVNDKDLSQKVQDYLITTSPEGQITPYPTFSTSKRKQIEDEVRILAIADAKKKAEATVSELGAKLGKVETVEDQNDGTIWPYMGRAELSSGSSVDAVATSSLPVLAGKQEINYTVQVTYQIK